MGAMPATTPPSPPPPTTAGEGASPRPGCPVFQFRLSTYGRITCSGRTETELREVPHLRIAILPVFRRIFVPRGAWMLEFNQRQFNVP